MDPSNTSVINVKINENNEIEYIDTEEVIEEDDFDIQLEEEEIDDDSVLVPTGEGVMTIKIKNKTVVEHVCGKCNKSYKLLGALKRHLNLCSNFPKSNVVRDNDDNLINIPEDEKKNIAANLTCFCCLEEKATAHSGHIKCNFCPKSFKSHINLERHLFTLHSASTEFPCERCIATCPSKEILKLHLDTHITGKQFSCLNCGKEFTRRYHLDRHLQYTGCDKTKPKLQLPCQVCNKIFTRTDNLREHLRGHMGQATRRKDYQCPSCDKSFYGSSLLNIHLRTHTGEKPFPCDLCDKAFPSNGALRKHRRMHTGEKPYVCKVCKKAFSAKETLNRHMKTHTGERPHKCSICNKSFIQASQLRAHIFHHTGENGFHCDVCQKAFNRKSRLEGHVKMVHEQEKPLTCQTCHKTFLRKEDMVRHTNFHLGIKTYVDEWEENNMEENIKKPEKRVKMVSEQVQERPLLCKTCNKTFLRKEDMVRHTNFHLGIKNYDCDICDKKFITKASLTLHKRIHIKEDGCKCKICNRIFIRMDCLMRHMRQKHRDVLLSIISDAEQKKIAECAKLSAASMENQQICNDEVDNCDVEEQIIQNKIPIETQAKMEIKDEIVTKVEISDNSYYQTEDNQTKDTDPLLPMSDVDLNDSICQLLNLLVDEDTLFGFGWPETPVAEVLNMVIEHCGQMPVTEDTCPDYSTMLRENTKLLFTAVIDNDSITSLLNNRTVDEVILHVIKLAC